MPSTISLRSVIDFNRTRTRMIQLVNVGGIPNQPALDICNDTLQTLLSAPNNWKFNKAQLPEFTTIPNQQDYWVSGATASVERKASVSINAMLADPPGLIPDTQGNVLVNFNRFAPHGIQGKGTSQMPSLFSVNDWVTIAGAGNGAFNGTFRITAVPSINSFVYYVGIPDLQDDGGQGINSWGWMERSVLEDYLSTAWVKPVREILAVYSLPQESIIQPPFKVCLQFERILQCGMQAQSELLIRFWPTPSSQIWQAYIFYQLKAQIKSSLEDNWAPWPDDLGYVLRSGVYSKALEHGEDPRSVTAVQLWQQDIARALGIRQQEERHEAFFPDLPVLRGG